ncbi:MAG: caspase family protein [Bacteroidetes bacterium]|nr:caspase family protein [Bacteroidota bacterium]MDA1120029.1 caspase family protein [Bacteroidota bacterium]
MKILALILGIILFASLTQAQTVTQKTPKITVNFADDEPSIISIFRPTELESLPRGAYSIKSAYLELAGRIEDAQGIVQFHVNGNITPIDNQGIFRTTIPLIDGENHITLKVIDSNNNETEKNFYVSRTAEGVEGVAVRGKYYALIVGINQYQDANITHLDQPIADAENLYAELTTKYTFDTENVTMLKNATYEDFIDAFDVLSRKVKGDDNLLIFYAGHGWWDEERELGYWLPSDARKANTAFWIRNSTISDYIGSIDSKHTLLVADACFSGSIFKTRSAFTDAQPAINKMYALPSRKAMTSGTLKAVPDKSVFLEYMVKRLDENEEKYLSAEKLFSSFRDAVLNNSPNIPQYGTVQNAGDEGGDFIFIRRDN